MSSGTPFKVRSLGEVTHESRIRACEIDGDERSVYGVDRHEGLTPEAKYTAEDQSRYKVLDSGMFAYNPMRLNIGSIAFCSSRHAPGLVSPDYVVFGCRQSELLPEYLAYVIRGPEWKHWTTAAGVGSVRVRIYYNELARMPLTVPPVSEQRRIAGILAALDDKVELDRQTNDTLEAMARAIFKSWFVDFDPVRAMAEGRRPDGMDSATAKLFPDKFQESPLGPVPAGWGVSTLSALAELILGGDWGSDAPSDETPGAAFCIRGADIPSLQSAGIGNMPLRYLKQSSLAKRALREGDLVVEISGGSTTQSTGRPVLVSGELLARLSAPLTCSNFCRLFRPSNKNASRYLYLLMREMYARDEFLQYENGTTGIKNFAFTIFAERHQILLPSPKVLDAFDERVATFFRAMQYHSVESATLAALRDALLPRLLSGELSAG